MAFTQWKADSVSLGRFSDSLWISSIIYISKSAVIALCPPTFPSCDGGLLDHPPKTISQITGAHLQSHTWGLQG